MVAASPPMTRTRAPADASDVNYVRGVSLMFANFAAGTLIVLGAVIAVLGFILGGSIPFVVVGLGAVAVGGLVSAAAKRTT